VAERGSGEPRGPTRLAAPVESLVEAMLRPDPRERPEGLGPLRRALATTGPMEACLAAIGASDGPSAPASLGALFEGPERVLDMPQRLADALWLRTGGDRRRVTLELGAWVDAGFATWGEGRLRVSVEGLATLEAGGGRPLATPEPEFQARGSGETPAPGPRRRAAGEGPGPPGAGWAADVLVPGDATMSEAEVEPPDLLILALLGLAPGASGAAVGAVVGDAGSGAPGDERLGLLAARGLVAEDGGRWAERSGGRWLRRVDDALRAALGERLLGVLPQSHPARLRALVERAARVGGEGARREAWEGVVRAADAQARALVERGRPDAAVALVERVLGAAPPGAGPGPGPLLTTFAQAALAAREAGAARRLKGACERQLGVGHPCTCLAAALERAFGGETAALDWPGGSRAIGAGDAAAAGLEADELADRWDAVACAIRLYDARGLPPGEALALIDTFPAPRSDAAAWDARRSSWRGLFHYRDGRYPEAVAAHLATAGAARVDLRLLGLVNAASAWLEVPDPAEARHLAVEAAALAREHGAAAFAARAEWLVRVADYRLLVAGGPDLELCGVVRLLGETPLLGQVLLTEAACAWRARQLGLAIRLAREAGDLLRNAPGIGGRLLARSLVWACEEGAEDTPARLALAEEDLERSARLVGPSGTLQAVGLVASRTPSPRLGTLAEELYARVPEARRAQRLDVLAPDEALRMARRGLRR
jgi:hypothetical protein